MKATCLEPVASVLSATSTEPLAVLAVRVGCALEHSIQRLASLAIKISAILKSKPRTMFRNCSVKRSNAARKPRPMPRRPFARSAGTNSRVCPPAMSAPSRYGPITVQRTRGYCKRCRKWRTPADAALGLEESAGYSAAVQDMAALLASKMPVEEAGAVLEYLSRVKVPRAALDREAKRQGERCEAGAYMDRLTDLSKQMPAPPADASIDPPSLTKEKIASLATLYDRFAHALDPYSPQRDEAERVFTSEIALL